MDKTRLEPIEIFLSYTRGDLSLVEELEAHLKTLQADKGISIWSDRDVKGDMFWQNEVVEHLKAAPIILLLVSQDYLDSSFVNDFDMPVAMARAESGSAKIVPVILRPCNWMDSWFVRSGVALPRGGRAVSEWNDREKAYLEITRGIGEIVDRIPRKQILKVQTLLFHIREYNAYILVKPITILVTISKFISVIIGQASRLANDLTKGLLSLLDRRPPGFPATIAALIGFSISALLLDSDSIPKSASLAIIAVLAVTAGWLAQTGELLLEVEELPITPEVREPPPFMGVEESPQINLVPDLPAPINPKSSLLGDDYGWAGGSILLPADLGPFRLEQVIGRGRMGEVFLAHDNRLERRVAIKKIPTEAAVDVVNSQRLLREAKIGARLSHPAILQIFDVVELGGFHWIVMEFVEGTTISQLVSGGPIEVTNALSIARQVAEGLAEAHDKGLLHRDLKAENVIVDVKNRVKILDFGLAKPPISDGEVTGHCRAMSPEQAKGLELDGRSDLFSLGVLLYEMTTGISPFRAPSPVDTVTLVCTHDPEPPALLNPDLPYAVSNFITRLLDKDRQGRPANALKAVAEIKDLENPAAFSGHRPRISW